MTQIIIQQQAEKIQMEIFLLNNNITQEILSLTLI